VARAALALRYRELRGEQAARRRLRRVDEGRAAGLAWVVVEESGDPDGDPFLPYSRLEVTSAGGRGVLVTTAADDAYRGVTHHVRRVRLDPGTGEVVADPDEAGLQTFPDATSRDEAAARLRSRLPGP
jgi:hypothetical protein